MSDEGKRTHFRFDFGGIQLELSGEREFVQEMYKEVMRDVERAREAVGQGEGKARKNGAKGGQQKPSIWLYRASELIRKIYMVARDEVEETILGGALEFGELGGVFIDKEVFGEFFPKMDGSQTLWAEFTAAGKELIAEASERKR